MLQLDLVVSVFLSNFAHYLHKKTTTLIMEENKDKVIDLTMILPKLFKGWKYYLVAFIATVAFSAAFIFTMPRYYTSKVMLAPESNDPKGNLNSLMNTFGIGGAQTSEDAISPMLYPDLMESRDFIISLFPVQVTTKDQKVSATYYDYLKNHRKTSWYGRFLDSIMADSNQQDSGTPSANGKKYSPSFMLSKEQDAIANLIATNIKYDYDKKNGVVSVTVTDQDPLVCALIADTVSSRLQVFITDYRTKKARRDLQYAERIHATAKAEYEKANAQYAAAADSYWNVVSESAKAHIQKLDNDKNLKFQTLSAVTQKLEASKAKLQEDTPVITMLQSAYVPMKPAGPKRMVLTLILMIVSFVFVTGYLILKKEK